uniref:Secreted protein n=1 Tax=Oryza meridionalis TaxID=40149 RepID=A0A0E0EM22_9ORYZ
MLFGCLHLPFFDVVAWWGRGEAESLHVCLFVLSCQKVNCTHACFDFVSVYPGGWRRLVVDLSDDIAC